MVASENINYSPLSTHPPWTESQYLDWIQS